MAGMATGVIVAFPIIVTELKFQSKYDFDISEMKRRSYITFWFTILYTIYVFIGYGGASTCDCCLPRKLLVERCLCWARDARRCIVTIWESRDMAVPQPIKIIADGIGRLNWSFAVMLCKDGTFLFWINCDKWYLDYSNHYNAWQRDLIIVGIVPYQILDGYLILVCLDSPRRSAVCATWFNPRITKIWQNQHHVFMCFLIAYYTSIVISLCVLMLVYSIEKGIMFKICIVNMVDAIIMTLHYIYWIILCLKYAN